MSGRVRSLHLIFARFTVPRTIVHPSPVLVSNHTSEVHLALPGWLLQPGIVLLSGLIVHLTLATASLGQQPVRASDFPTGQATENPLRQTLKTGSQGAEVSELQATLKLLGFYAGEVDGVYGQSTATAVSQFQQAAGLPADGVTGPATWSRLFPSTPNVAVTTSTPSNRPNIKPNPAPSITPAPKPSGVTTPTQPVPSATATQTPNPVTTKPQPVSGTTATSAPTKPITVEAPLPANSNAAAFPILKIGMKGPAVVGLQNRLRAIGVFKGSSDGVFGTETQDAVKAAQRKFNLSPDGVVGPATWVELLQ